jgi:hypothetical protein
MSPIRKTLTHAVAAVALMLPLMAHAQERDMHVVSLPQGQWPGNVVVDISQDKCESLTGARVSPGRNVNLCYITTAMCETNKGWHVVMRDAYMTAAARIAACRHTG